MIHTVEELERKRRLDLVVECVRSQLGTTEQNEAHDNLLPQLVLPEPVAVLAEPTLLGEQVNRHRALYAVVERRLLLDFLLGLLEDALSLENFDDLLLVEVFQVFFVLLSNLAEIEL